jgi:threonine dehydratase
LVCGPAVGCQLQSLRVSITLDLAALRAAQRRIAGRAIRTGLQHSKTLSQRTGSPVFLKMETRQQTGSFKLRGATSAIRNLESEQRGRGLVTVSTGNHGRAVAFAGRAESLRVVVCLSSLVPANKVAAIREFGAEVSIVGNSQDDAQVEAERLARDEGLILISPFDDPAVIAGQGTIGLEILDDLPEVSEVLVPLSGGGLAGGIALAIKSQRPHARIIGISMSTGAAMHASLEAGQPVIVPEGNSLADSLGGGIGLDNRFTFDLCRRLLDDVILLSEAEIASGIRHAFQNEGEVVEGAGAVGIAAILAGKVTPAGPTAIIISGRNIDAGLHRRILDMPAVA